ncbi:MAG TPA: hypothetical protein PLJ21_12580 [Pseudobdellovibrionaceae bacterium]|nr:hypothetical protein [Pseudobdellovibrionaceae bacterium]
MIFRNFNFFSVCIFIVASFQSLISYGNVLNIQNTINFECSKSSQVTASHQFKASGVFIISESPQNDCKDSVEDQLFCIQGEIQGEFFLAGKDSQREILKPKSFQGTIKTYPAGTLYAKEVRVLILKSDNNFARIILAGPVGSSQFSNQGFWYQSTCEL